MTIGKGLREVIVIHDDYHERLAKLVLAHLNGKCDGIILSRRNQRWGCNPNFYKLVVLVDDASIPESGKANIFRVSVESFSLAKESETLSDYTIDKHWDLQAASISEKVCRKL
jgi:hypothetical protein